ncbi:MAG: HlyC/CorC family transporter [Alphaproteobacteria bacterium]|nr:HlyC/CorC family transporter [Alphaproteobacteria bacterium]MCB9697900.1 HlyC/CorC family transporter [Alphaproteobacteria bacterium]
MTLQVGAPLIAVVLALQGFFSGSEMALVSANRARLEARRAEGSRGAALVLDMMVEEERVFGTCLVGTNLALITGTTIVGAMLAQAGHTEEWKVALAYFPLALLFGEALPKTLFRHWADVVAVWVAFPIKALQVVLTPVLIVLSVWGSTLKRLLRTTGEESIKREDIVQLLNDRQGHKIDAEDRAFIRRLLAMNETLVREAMTPLVDVTAISDTTTIAQAIEVVLREGHSRMPVYTERVDNLQGRINHKDLLFAEDDQAVVTTIMKPVRFVPESKPVDALLHEMRESGDPFAVVVDEYGGSVGIVTMEDLLELVVGDIEDEGDLPHHSPAMRKLGELQWRVPARTDIEDLEEETGFTAPSGEYETVAGLLLTATGRIPATGETVRIGRATFYVEAASERAVHMLRMTVDPKTEE